MNNEKMARLIVELRKEKKLTQKELAAKLGVTDKAVSKWERGLSSPDIALLSTLSEILGITTSELLNGELSTPPTPETEALVEKTLEYADANSKNKLQRFRKISGAALTICSLIGILTCIICDYAIAGNLTWSYYVISSVIFSWLVVMPILTWERKGPAISLLLLSILTIPYLYILELVIGEKGLIMPIGSWSAIIGLIYLWIAYILFSRTKLYKYAAAGITILLSFPVSISINAVVARVLAEPLFDIWDVFSQSIIIVIGSFILGFGFSRYRKILKR